MEKKMLQTYCFLIFITLCYAAETGIKPYDEQNIYDLTGLFAKVVGGYHNSMQLKRLKPLDTVQLQGIDKDFEFMPSGIQLQNTSKCLQDLIYTVENIKSEWGLKMIDSYGKPESGILKGNYKWIGDYNECVGIRAHNPNSTTVGNFRGKYCSLTWSLKKLNLSLPFQFVSGVCIPDSCSAAELQQDALQLLYMAGTAPVLNDSNTTLDSNALQCKPTERHLNTAAKAMIGLLSVFCALTLLGSSVTAVKYFSKIIQESKNISRAYDTHINNEINGDHTMQKHDVKDDEALLQDGETVTAKVSIEKSLVTFLECFCVFKNGAKLLNTSSSEGELLCIHGIRFLSMSWVILGHSYIFGYGQMKNMMEVITLVDNFPFQAILQAFFSVDSFFVLSGFLLTFLCMKEFSKTKGKISWPYFYIHRYLRLTPIYMVLLGFSATLYLYIGSGPYWPVGDYDAACRKFWWRNLLYINNFDVEALQCFGWSWYLANDMQFFIISPLFLITLWRWPKMGYLLIAIFLWASCLCNFFITHHFDLANGLVTFLNDGISDVNVTMKKFTDYFIKLYVKPYTRIGPYLVGMLTGFIFFKRKASNAPKHSLVFLTIGWIVASSVTLATVYGLYHTHPGLIARSIYNAVSRICYAAGLSWVVYVCLIGQGGFINSLLSFKLFIPLSRLTYAAYLIHPMVINGYLLSLRTSLEFTHPTMVVLFLGFMLVTYALSLPVALILESPIVALEKLIRKKFTTEQETKAVTVNASVNNN